MLNRPSQPFGLPRMAALFSLILLLIGQGSAPLQQGGPADEPPPDAPTPAMLRAEDWAGEPLELAPGILAQKEQINEGSNLSWGVINYLYCTAFRRDGPNIFTAADRIVYTTFLEPDWDIATYTPCYELDEAVTMLTSDAADNFEPRLSFDAKWVTFVSNRDGNEEIYSVDVEGNQEKRLTYNPHTDTMPVYSPDGGQILFVSDRSGYAEIYSMDAAGGNPTQLTRYKMLALYPDYSPDGKSIVFTLSNGSVGQVVELDRSGRNPPRALTKVLPLLGRARWSPDGKKLALEYDSNGDGWLDLGMVNADGSGLKLLAKGNPNYDLELGNWTFDRGMLFYHKVFYVYYLRTWYLSSLNQCYMHISTGENKCVLNSRWLNIDVRWPDKQRPEAWLIKPPEWNISANTYRLAWVAMDRGVAGLFETVVEVSRDNGATWATWLSYKNNGAQRIDDTLTKYDPVAPGTTLLFRVRATDLAGNTIPAAAAPVYPMRFYKNTLNAIVKDVRDHPLENARLSFTPQALATPFTNAEGKALVYLPAEKNYRVETSHAGYGAQPAKTWQVDPNRQNMVLLSGNDERLVNGFFDDDPALNGWQVSNPEHASPAEGWDDSYGAKVFALCADGVCLDAPEQLPERSVGAMVVDRQNTLHMASNSGRYYYRESGGVWQTGEPLPAGIYKLMLGPDDTLYAAGTTQITQSAQSKQIYKKVVGEPWSLIWTGPEENTSRPAMELDGLGRLNIFFFRWLDVDTYEVVHTLQGTDGEWAPPRTLFSFQLRPHNFGLNFQTDSTLAPDGTIYLTFTYPYSDILRGCVLRPDGSFEEIVFDLSGGDAMEQSRVVASSDGTPYVLARRHGFAQGGNQYQYYLWHKLEEGGWSDPSLIFSGTPTSSSFDYYNSTADIEIDAQDNMRVVILDVPRTEDNLIYLFLPHEGGGQRIANRLTLQGTLTLDFSLDAKGREHLLYGARSYAMVSYSDQPEVGTLSQAVHLPETMHKPTLSFFYRMEQLVAGGASSMEVLVQEDGLEPVSLLVNGEMNGEWKHAWADLTPWLGKDITVQFRVNQAQGEYSSRLVLDEVSVSSWESPRLQGVTPDKVDEIPSEGVWVRVQGENLMAGSRVFLGGKEAASVDFDAETGELLVFLDLSTPKGWIDLRVEAPGGADGTLKEALRVGDEQFLPLALQ